MGIQIEDGTGSGNQVSVSSENRLNVSARTGTRLYYCSRNDGNAYCWTAVSADVAAGVGGIYLANNSTSKSLFIERIYLWADVVTQFKVWCPASYTAPNGTAIVGVNLNRKSGKTADATCTANETNNAFAAAQTITTVTNSYYDDAAAAGSGQWIEYDGALILGYHDSVSVELVADTAAFEITIMGHFHGD